MSLRIFFCLLGIVIAQSQQRSATVYCTAGKCSIKFDVIDKTGVAYGTFADTLNTTGWGVLNIVTNPRNSDYDQMFGAGYLEGALTNTRIYEMSNNMNAYFFEPPDYMAPPTLVSFFNDQEKWTYQQIAANTSNFWQQVNNVQGQFDGLVQGYFDNHVKGQDLTRLDFQVLNGVGDLLDLMHVVTPEKFKNWEDMTDDEFQQYFFKYSMCSALIKVTGNYSDLFAGHSSWFTYSAMNRIFKYYTFNLNNPTTAARTTAFSSYPGFLESLDDFYIMDSNLTMIQTTNGIYNSTLYTLVVPQALFAWQRVKLANTMAHNGPEWFQIVSQYNSGTYNNQYMVIDYNLFEVGIPLPDNTLFVVEQIPGLVVGGDVTNELERGYFASYNIPYWKQIYNLSGYPSVVSRRGYDYSYQLAPRANIFRRDQGNVVNLDTFKHILRDNNFKTDPYSKSSPYDAICSRGDLANSPSANGCYDTKVTSQTLQTTLSAWAVNGPTTEDGLPPFSWVDPFDQDAHYGEPTLYNFTFVYMTPSTF